MIRINVFIQVSEANRAALIEAGKELVACSQKDKGCVAYDLFASTTREDVLMICDDLFASTTREDVLMICETWTDEASLSAHEQAAHFQTLVPKIQSLGTMKIEKFNF